MIVALGVLLAVNLLIFAAHTGGQGQDNPGPPLPAEIESLVPVPGAVIRPQEDVGADLKDTYIGALAPGNHHATILYWPQEKGDEDAARKAGVLKSYTWQFTAG